MKKNNKKGFTIVELVIVIAVIAILSAVLIPTFGGIIEDANESAALQKASNAYKSYLIQSKADDSDLVIVVEDKYVYTVTDGKLNDTPTAAGATYTSPAGFSNTEYALEENGADVDVYVECTTHAGTNTCTNCGATISGS